jgi:hypothetical protein
MTTYNIKNAGVAMRKLGALLAVAMPQETDDQARIREAAMRLRYIARAAHARVVELEAGQDEIEGLRAHVTLLSASLHQANAYGTQAWEDSDLYREHWLEVRAERDALLSALADCQAIHMRIHTCDLCDAIDNNGRAYQSQYLADALARLTERSES